MNAKQQRFVAEYLIDLNATQAAIRAGYSEKTARTIGPRLLSNVAVAKAVEAGKSRQLKSADLSAARVLEELRRLAFSDVRTLFDESGNLRPLHTLSDEHAAPIAGVEVVHRNLTAGDSVTDTIHKVKIWDKSKNLENLAKHFGLLEDKLNVSGQFEVAWKGM